GDLDERALWYQYMNAFEDAIERCGSETAPWYVIPAENRRFRDALLSQLLLETLAELDPQYPQPEYDDQKYTADSIGNELIEKT
ncbi:MAG: hypothetical protein AAF197_07875, partial [Pseudomonadota bacterium]